MKVSCRSRLLAFVLVALSAQAVAAEKQKFDPESVFGLALDSHLPFDQESHANDTNYVHASVERIEEDVRVWGRRFRGFAPRFVFLGPDHGIESITAIRGDDLEVRKLPALFKAIDGYFAGFSGISPAEGRSSETNRTWEGVSPDGIGYSVDVYSCFVNPVGTAQIRMTLRSESDRCGAELRKAKLEKEDKERIAAAYRMMRTKEYEGAWIYTKGGQFFAICFVKGGLGVVNCQMSHYMFYWDADNLGNIDATVAFSEGVIAKMSAKFLPEANAFDFRCERPEYVDCRKKETTHGDVADGGVASMPKREPLIEGRARPSTGKSQEKMVCEFLNRCLGVSDITPPLVRTVPEKLTAAPFEAHIRPSKTMKLASFADLPDFKKRPKHGCWTLKGSGVCKLRAGFEKGDELLLAVTIGEEARSDEKAPSFSWLKRALPELVDARSLFSRVPNGVPDEKAERILELSEQSGFKVEEKSFILNMFWHYRREDQLHIRFPKEKVGEVAAFIKMALDGVLEFPVEMEVY